MRVDSQVARELNRTTLYDLVRARGVVSRAALARATGLSKATVSEIIDRFIREGFVRTLGPGESNGGRRPTLLGFDPCARHAVGVELGDAACRVVLTNLHAEPVRSAWRPVRTRSADDAVAAAAALIGDVTAGLPPGRLIGVGVGTPGLVDSRRGVIQMAPDLGWRDVPAGPRLADRFAVPVAVVNRAKAAALAEGWRGAGRDVDNLVYVSVSTGIAAGIVINGRLYRGASMSEGELGHVTALLDGPLCGCGNRGCLQAVAAGPAIVARVREKLRTGQPSTLIELANGKLDLLTLESVAAAAAADDPLVLGVLDEVALYLGVATANLINILNPRMLILGGGVVRALPALVHRVEAVVRARAMSVPAAAVAVVPSQLGPDAVPTGAAAFLLSQVSVVGSGLRPMTAPVPNVVHPGAGPR
ncbi:MAG TPA: ROK family protein [Chloroflexota bacterium]|nr:ROK family protein [Chloroflexota bacterium]